MSIQILLVEDSKTQAEQIKAMLEKAGDIDVDIAYGGLEGLRQIQQKPPQLVILEVILPDMNGYQVCRRIKRNPETSSIPVIILTQKSSTMATQAGLQAGADDYIPKDVFASEHLIDTLSELGLIP